MVPRFHQDFVLFPNLQHVQQRRLAGIVQPEEEELGVLIGQAERGQDVPD